MSTEFPKFDFQQNFDILSSPLLIRTRFFAVLISISLLEVLSLPLSLPTLESIILTEILAATEI